MEVDTKILDRLEREEFLSPSKSVGLCFCTEMEYEEIVKYYEFRYKFDLITLAGNENEWDWVKNLKVDVIYADINFIGEKDPSVFELYTALQPGGILVLKCFTKFNASQILAAFFNYTPYDLRQVAIDNSHVLIYKSAK